MGAKKPATVKITIPDSMIDDYAKQTIATLEHRVKELEKENNKLKTRMSAYPLDKKKKELKEIEARIFMARGLFKDAIQDLIERAGFHVTEYEIEENTR